MAKASNLIDLGSRPKRHVTDAASPFRYPGGKGFLTPLLADQLAARFPDRLVGFAEPFCGGAGAAMNLLVDGLVSQLYLNDADIRMYSSWYAMVNETERFVEKLHETQPTIAFWEHNLRLLYDVSDNVYNFDLGFAAFFINRTSRSGVLLGSGPIGGYDQTGNWKIDARYYKDSLSKRILRIGDNRSKIRLHNLDGLEFCKLLQHQDEIDKTFLFIDPPYVKAGGRLYHDGMTISKHDALASWLVAGNAPHWLLTYDDHPIIRENYKSMSDYMLDVRYSLGTRRVERELLYMS